MNGSPPLVDQEMEPCPTSQWTAGLGRVLREAEVLRHELTTPLPLEIRRAGLCVWLIFSLSRSLKIGMRSPFDPAGLRSVRFVKETPTSMEITARGGFGDYRIRIEVLESTGTMVRCTTTLTPASNLKLEALPRDLCMLDGRLEPWSGKGRLFTVQTGNTAGQMYFKVPGKPGGTVFYFQNLSSLADYCRQTGAKVGGTVVAQWPDAGFALPGGDRPMEAGKPVVIRDAFLEVREGVPDSEARAAELFLNALGRIYPLLPRPPVEYYDWPVMAQKALRALTKCRGCCRNIERRTYVQAYVDSVEKPPESMVQGAIMVPLMEYETWQRRPVQLLKKLRHVPESFYHKALKVPVRWLPGVDFQKEEPSEEETKFRMDSWYLIHTMLNLGRMAEMGMESARKVFLNSLETVIHAAHRFHYDWPVFYDQRNLNVFKEETQPGEGGEQDAAGIYVHIMLQAYNLTHRKEYLAEAEASAQKIARLSFGVLYQTNNTAMTAVALARLWHITSKSVYKDLSLVCVASILSHLWLWHAGPRTTTFMGLPPLHDAPYIAFYEEAEVLASLLAWHQLMDGEVPEGASLLFAEYQKHLLARARYYYPAELPPESLADEPKEGPISRRLSVPLEGLGPPEDKAGTVGQAVYGAGAPFVLATRCWHRPGSAPFVLFCEYPALRLEYEGTRPAGVVRLYLAGTKELSCLLRLFPSKRSKAVYRIGCAEGVRCRWHEKGPQQWSSMMPGGSHVTITWDTPQSL